MKKVALLGTAPSSFSLAPFANEEWDIWACSPGTASAPRADRRYELHRWEPEQEWFSEGYIKILSECKGPVIMSEQVDVVPNCQVIDWMAHVERFGPYFFTSTLAWMMADAIVEGYEKIALYGVDMAATSEYHDQRMGCQYFAMLAASMGIEVGVPPESDLLRPAPLYGIAETSHLWIKETSRARELAGRLRTATDQAAALDKEIHFLNGALDDQDWHLHSIVGAYDTQNSACISPIVPGIWKKGVEEVAESMVRTGDPSRDQLESEFGKAKVKSPPKKKRGRQAK